MAFGGRGFPTSGGGAPVLARASVGRAPRDDDDEGGRDKKKSTKLPKDTVFTPPQRIRCDGSLCKTDPNARHHLGPEDMDGVLPWFARPPGGAAPMDVDTIQM